MRLLIALVVALGGLAFWRRKHLKDDVLHAKNAGAKAVASTNARVRAEISARRGDNAGAAKDETEPANPAAGAETNATTSEPVAL
jgi:hypothetical protein